MFFFLSIPVCVSGLLCHTLYTVFVQIIFCNALFKTLVQNKTLAITAFHLKITQKLFPFCDSFYSFIPVRSQTAFSARRVGWSVVDFTASPIRLCVPHAPCTTTSSTLTTSVFRLPERRPGFGYGKKSSWHTTKAYCNIRVNVREEYRKIYTWL